MGKETIKEFARRELARRQRENGPMLSRWKFFWSPLLLLGIALLICSLAELPGAWGSSREVQIAAAIGLACAIPLFLCFPMLPVYVFSHEMTHWLAARCFFRKTGKLTLKGASGALEVPHTNWVIVLAPYVFPFYFFIVAGLCAFAGLFWRTPPLWFEIASAAASSLCYGYHLVLTGKALRRGQEDIRYCGGFFATLAILCGNLFFLYLALMIAGGIWEAGVSIPAEKISTSFARCMQWLNFFLH